jgi:hypothetical protein
MCVALFLFNLAFGLCVFTEYVLFIDQLVSFQRPTALGQADEDQKCNNVLSPAVLDEGKGKSFILCICSLVA